MIYFTSDTHFCHKNIIRFQPDTRGHFESIDEMDDTLIKNWNRLVTPQDTVYHLGDFGFTNQGNIYSILGRLNGSVHLLIGNHDKAFRKVGFRSNLIDRDLISEFYQGYHELSFNKTLIVLNHYAQRVWNKSHYGSIHLYGHSHGSLPGIGKSVDVGVDSLELAEYVGRSLSPYSLDEVFSYMANRDTHEANHHKEKK